MMAESYYSHLIGYGAIKKFSRRGDADRFAAIGSQPALPLGSYNYVADSSLMKRDGLKSN